MRLLLTWVVNAIALIALPYVFSSIKVDSFPTALLVAVVLGFVNAIIRPVLVILTLPVTILTLGLFILFWAVGSFWPGFHVDGFWAGVFGAIVYSIISWILSSILMPSKEK